MFTVILEETTTKENVNKFFQQAENLGIPAQKTREQPPQFQRPLGLYFFPGFYCFGNIYIETRNINTAWGEPQPKKSEIYSKCFFSVFVHFGCWC